MIRSVQGLGDFYRKSEVEFLGKEINFKFLTPEQLDNEIAKGIALYNEMYPPRDRGFMVDVIKVGMVGAAVVMTGGAVLAAYGVGMGTAVGAVVGAGSATAAAGSTIASVQTAASAIAVSGALYGKVTGDTPEDLIKVSQLVTSENALDIMEKVAKDELAKKGVKLQKGDKASNDALKERLRKEQQILSEKMMLAADEKAKSLGQPTPEKQKIKGMDIAVLATPFLLYFLG